MIEFNHVGLVVTDLAASIKFYQETLGLRVFEDHPNAVEGVEIAFIGGEVPAVELLCFKDPARRERVARGRYDHLTWRVDDIEQVVRHLQELGIEIEPSGIRKVMEGRRIAFFAGPDGERIEITERAK